MTVTFRSDHCLHAHRCKIGSIAMSVVVAGPYIGASRVRDVQSRLRKTIMTITVMQHVSYHERSVYVECASEDDAPVG